MKPKFKKTIFSFLILFLVFCAKLQSQISNDAIVLTLRVQEGIFLDSAFAKHIDSALTIARTIDDSLSQIIAFPDYAVDEMILSSSAEWTNAWKTGSLLTGNSYIDSLGEYYGLTKVDTNRSFSILPLFILKFASPLQIKTLSKLYNDYPGVNYAEPNGSAGDWHDIQYLQKEGKDHFAFSFGAGDCPAGCTYRYYWYVTVTRNNGNLEATLEESRVRGGKTIYRWNIPDRYPMTMFPNLDSILATIKFSPHWWVRKHAIEGLWRFYQSNYPWVGEDTKARWDSLRGEIFSRQNDVVAALENALNDVDEDVRASVKFALSKIGGIISKNYFPLHIGNSWTYTGSSDTLSKRTYGISGSINIGNENYYLFGQAGFSKDTIRKNVIGNIWKLHNGVARLWFDFTKDNGAVYVFQSSPGLPYVSYVSVSKNITVKTHNGTYSNCIRFNFNIPEIIDDEISYTFADGVGLIQKYGAWSNDLLYSASIHENPLSVTTDLNSIASSFILKQNYPNPFNPTTQIQFYIAQESDVSLKIYNVLGQKVTVLVDAKLVSGTHSFNWNAEQFPSGIYFYVLHAGEFTDSKKMILLK